jgi:4-hydroxybenzoate polyprenyltransferase
MNQTLLACTRLMRFHRPIGIFLLLWPTLWALWIAGLGHPNKSVLLIFVCGVIVMRAAGCVINDIADHRFDGHVARTRQRPLVTGELTVRTAWSLFIGLCLLALALVLMLNKFAIILSVVGLLLAMIYPFMKRYTYWPQIVLGAAYGWAIPMAFAAETQQLSPVAGLLFIIVLLWTLSYDTMYAMTDRADDLQIGVKSTAILFASADRFILGMLQLLVLALLTWLGLWQHFTLSYYIALLFAAGLSVYQQYLIKDRDPARCFLAFQNNNWLGAVVWLGVVFGS